MHVVLAGGGTAGHVEPALNLADALRRDDPAVGITLLGTERGLETSLVPARGYDLALVPAVPLPRKPNLDLLAVGPRVSKAVAASRAVLMRVGADVVVGFGGYVALPAYLAARREKVPIVVHEANARAGLANRVGARLTPYVTETVIGSIPRAERVGIPLRRSISELDRADERAAARAFFGLDPELPTLLVFGGSQGARRLNVTMAAAAAPLRAAGVQVLHAVGPRNVDDVAAPPPGPVPYVALPYVDRMDLAYAAADLALCRAGAMTCAELAAVGLPAAYVPLPIGNGEQRLNALPVVRAGGGLIVDDADLDADWLMAHVAPLLADPVALGRMGAAAAAHGVRDADRRLVAVVRRAVAGVLEDGGHR
ncbi:MAG: UDP-N-acetylglucosamine--N-acetylmuramyl-(pentapeptide) pyrophosphoryl-undecaprenol N-acetylglucosamine transferase [Candidatus Nanopelagicales bacterium]